MFGFILPRVAFEWWCWWPWHSRRQWNWNGFWIPGTGIGNAQLSSKIWEREPECYYSSVKVANNKIFCKGKWHFPIENLDNWINPLYSVAFVVYLTATKRKPGISITKIKKILTIGPTRSVAAERKTIGPTRSRKKDSPVSQLGACCSDGDRHFFGAPDAPSQPRAQLTRSSSYNDRLRKKLPLISAT